MADLLNTTLETKKGLKLHSRIAESKDVPTLTNIINWAYRGKDGADAWTTEKHLVRGQRINEVTLTKEISTDKNLKTIFLVELIQDESSKATEADGANASNNTIVGTIKIERESADDKNAMIGMFGVDPSLQSGGIGGVLFKIAENYIKSVWNVNDAVLHVISVRAELLKWYESMGYKRTGVSIPFHNKDDKLDRAIIDDLHFIELVKPL